ncbi:helix-turn-helix domain-containing protein [Candidatus Dojkabacteria bacterium]|jgi:DNA-directed RNA polymerase sigma subunit (sigma70/sigma32)|nr:helix-turn-helix domain-containing protein [Candidatus Dojkabacteria bacterium]
MKRIERINQYLEQGKTYEEIGDILGVSRQRIEQII